MPIAVKPSKMPDGSMNWDWFYGEVALRNQRIADGLCVDCGERPPRFERRTCEECWAIEKTPNQIQAERFCKFCGTTKGLIGGSDSSNFPVSLYYCRKCVERDDRYQPKFEEYFERDLREGEQVKLELL